MPRLRLSLVCSEYDTTAPLLRGEVQPEGIDLICTRSPPADTFWQVLKFGEFDVAEMSMSFYLMARSRGRTDYIAIPVFPMRMFFQTGIVVNKHSGIQQPRDLRGKRFGLPEYGISLALWIRGILKHEYDVPPESIEWYIERPPTLAIESALGGVQIPANVRVRRLQDTESLNGMLIDGRIDACFSYATFFPVQTLADRSIATNIRTHPNVKPLFDDIKKAQIEYYRKTGIQPINHIIIIKTKVLQEHPWVAMNLFKAFQKSKEISYQRAREIAYTHNSYVWLGQLYEEVQALFGGDPLPYGIQRNLKTLETVVEYSHEQGFISEKIAPASLFYESTRSL